VTAHHFIGESREVRGSPAPSQLTVPAFGRWPRYVGMDRQGFDL